MFKYPMIERANGAGRRAEEGSAAFFALIFTIHCGAWYLFTRGWEVLFQFLASRLFIYIHVLIILGPNICFFTSPFFTYPGGLAALAFLCFFPPTWTQKRVERDTAEKEGGNGEGNVTA